MNLVTLEKNPRRRQALRDSHDDVPSQSSIERKHRLARVLLYTTLIGGTTIMLIPLVWMVATSLKTFAEVQAYPPALLPERPQWSNYVEAFRNFSFGRYLCNSLFLTVLSVLGTLVSCTLAAFAFTVYDVPGRKILFGFLLAALMLPGQVTIIPQFKLFAELGMVNTFMPLLIPVWLGGNVFAIFLLRQFFLTLPRDYIEAARIDGASEIRILWSIFVPLSKPALLTVTVFTFLGSWNDLWGPLIYLHDENLYTMPLGILRFMAEMGRPEGAPMHLIMAVSTVMVVPIILLFFLAQKRFIEGIATTGIK
jgi:multiple sugar transport system permease protein